MGWLSIILGLVDPITRITDAIAKAKLEQAKAVTDREKVAADERIATLQAQRDVLIAESGSRINACMRLAFAIPPAIYLGKLFVWDKVLKWGITDPLSPMLEGVMWTIVGFYFLNELARVVKR